MPEIEKVDSRNEISCLKWTIYKGRSKVCIGFKIDMDKLNIVVYRYRNNTYVKDTELELKLTDYEKLLSKRVYLFSYIEVFFRRCIVLDETTVHNQNNFHQEWMLSFWWIFFDFTSKWNPNFFAIVLEKIYFSARVTIGMGHVPDGTWIKTFCTVERLVMETRTWTLCFATPKYSDYMQYCTMLLEQLVYKAVKDLATATWLVEVQTNVCLVTWLDYHFVFT